MALCPRGLPGFYSLSDVMEHKRCSILRGYLHLPQSVPYLCMLHELGCVPLVHAYVLRAVRFYNSLVRDGQGGVYCGVLQQNIADARRGRSPVHNWFSHLWAVLRLIMPTGRWLSDVRNLQELNIKQVKRALVDAYDKYTASFRTVHEGEGSKIGFYFREMAGHSVGKQPDYMSLCLPRRLQRDERTCLRCSLVHVDDEMHCLFECRHPALQLCRARFPVIARLPCIPRRMRDFMVPASRGPAQWCGVVHYVTACMRVVDRCYSMVVLMCQWCGTVQLWLCHMICMVISLRLTSQICLTARCLLHLIMTQMNGMMLPLRLLSIVVWNS
eukprot:jgi/Chrzof1/8510/Cz03g13220.t1